MHYKDPFAPAEAQSAINDIMQAAGERKWPAGWFDQNPNPNSKMLERKII